MTVVVVAAIAFAICFGIRAVLRRRAATIAERQHFCELAEQARQAEYRRAHLMGVAQHAVMTGQEGPFFGAGTVTASHQEMEAVLGSDWREVYGKPREYAPGTFGTAIFSHADLGGDG